MTSYRGRSACPCQVLWFPVFERELRDLGLIEKELSLAQLIGDAAASAKVHTGGGAADWWETDTRIAQVARDMGAPATWTRTTGSFASNQHTHSVLRGCPHLASGAVAQIREVDAGGDGLLGTVPDPPALKSHLNRLSWQQGILWAEKRQMKRQREITFGTHNTLDGAARETPFADVIIFTEAIPREVRLGLARTHRVWVCEKQRDMVLAVDNRLHPRMVRQEYRKAHRGIPLVTPKRGTWRTDLELLDVPVSGIWDHRINASFYPWIRGERIIRSRFWAKHTAITKEMIREAKIWARVILAGGDPNTSKTMTAYGDVLRSEVGEGKDRLGSNREITNVEELSKAGSDHHRLRGTVQL